MLCNNCGAELKDGSRFCEYCGAPAQQVEQPQQPQYQQPQYQQPQYQQPQYQQPQYQQPQYQQPQYQQPMYQDPAFQQPYVYQQGSNLTQPELPMKWFNFLVKFALIAGAILNILGGIMSMTGMQYGALMDDVYDMFEELQGIDVVYGIACIGLGIFGFFVWKRLSGYYENGPKMLNTLYLVSAVVSLIYGIVVAAIVGGDVDVSSSFSSFAVSMVMVSCNATYFKKRAHLFTNQ